MRAWHGAASLAAMRDDAMLEPFRQEIPSSAFSFRMMPAPGDAPNQIEPFWISECEITWEAFDCFVYRLDEPQAGGAPERGSPDAVTRPSKPYLPPDRGFGHDGFAAISMSYRNAVAFCEWLSEKSGRRYRLPTQAEWEHACRAGSTSRFSFGDDVAALDEHAWHAGNSDGVPHAVGTKRANTWGLHDMHGNVMEWCTAPDGSAVACGGSYRDAANDVECGDHVKPSPAWNASDPQVPKSKWWLADAPFVGFRVVCERPAQPPASKPAVPRKEHGP